MIVGRRHTARHGKLRGSDAGDAVDRDGEAPCVLVFHGFTGTPSELEPMLERISARGHAVRAPLLSGHGSTATALQDLPFEQLVLDMAGHLERAIVDHRRVVVAGFSLGSLLAIEVVARALAEPSRASAISGLVLLGNALTLAPAVSAALGFVDRRGLRLPDWYLVKLWSADLRDPAQRKRIRAYDRDPLRAALEVYRGGVKARASLGAITCPTLVLHGALDRVCPVGNVALAAAELGTRDVTTRVFPRSAHLVCADHDREDVALAVCEFVARVGRTTGAATDAQAV